MKLAFFAANLYLLPLAIVGAGVEFNYKDPESNWCSPKIEGSVCCSGKRQSPINIDTQSNEIELDREANRWSYDEEIEQPLCWSSAYMQPTVGKLFNTGSTVEFKPEYGNFILGCGVLAEDQKSPQYELLQIHFHWKSEHTVDGKRYDGEVHYVHRNLEDPNDYVVVGFFLDDSTPFTSSDWLQSLIDEGIGTSIVDKGDTVSNVSLTLSSMFEEVPDMSRYAFYSGSLTTPLCSEVVTWIVMLEPIEIDASQLDAFKKVKNFDGKKIKKNYRPTQPLNDRIALILQEV